MKNVTKNSNEEGFVLVAAIVILMMLTIIGITTTTNTSLDLQISGNYRTVKELFYECEAAAAECGQILAGETEYDELLSENTSNEWLHKKNDDGSDPMSSENISVNGSGEYENAAGEKLSFQTSSVITNAGYGAVHMGILSGDSERWDSSIGNVHTYHIYGEVNKGNSSKLIEIGYRRRITRL